jgi:hypothetical protein
VSPLTGVMLVMLLLGVVVLFLFDPARFPIYPACYFHKMTGMLCPGCGATRAMHQLLHGHVGAAMHFNVLFVLLLPAACWVGLSHALAGIQGRAAPAAVQPKWLWLALGLMLAFGILRNLPFAWCAWMAC